MPAVASQSRHEIDLAQPEFREMRRAATVERESINRNERTVEFSFASAQPVDRWFGREVLEITTDACDLSRLNGGGACLVNHNWDDQVGVVEKAWIDAKSGKARARVKFSRTQRGTDIFQDITDGIRSLVSVGYIVRKMVLQSVEGDVETHRVTDWQPFEVSLVPVPADPSVGVGRSDSHSLGKSAATPAAPQSTRKMSVSTEEPRNAAAEIMGACKVLTQRHPVHRDAILDLATRTIQAGGDEATFNRSVLNDILATRDFATPVRSPSGGDLGLSKREIAGYSLLKVVRARLEGRGIDGIEREAHEAEAKRLGRSAEGIFVPNEVFRSAYAARSLSVGTASAGGYLVPESIDTANMVPLLRNASHVVSLGARTMAGLTGDVSIPRVLTGSTVYWVSENGEITASAPTFGQILMKPRRIGGRVKITKQLSVQSSVDVETFVRTDIFDAFATEIDRVAINGAAGAQPLGILNLTAADRSASVTFGAAATLAKVCEFETNVSTSNALSSPAFLTTPATRGKWKAIQKFTGGGVGIWNTDEDVIGYRGRVTNQFPTSPVANQVIFGDFGQVFIGEWTGNDVIIDPFTAAATGEVWVTIQKIVDIVIRQGKSFAISSDSGAQ
ncbi:MAG: phage major capsid protein [Verrucomicrobiota bacterium]